MKNYVLSVLIALSVLAVPTISCAQLSSVFNSNLPDRNPFIYIGQKTSITNFKVGTCKELDNGYWMQLADGTWADPNSALNLCSANGQITNWLNSNLYNPWLRSGIGQNDSTFSTAGVLQNNGYKTSNFGSFSSYQDWYTNCVIMESIYPRPECQNSSYNGYYNNPWDLTYGANLFARITIGDTGTITLAGSSSSKDLNEIIGGAILYSLLCGMFD
jgi:hypothetical protein